VTLAKLLFWTGTAFTAIVLGAGVALYHFGDLPKQQVECSPPEKLESYEAGSFEEKWQNWKRVTRNARKDD